MVFCIKVSLANFYKDKPNRNCLQVTELKHVFSDSDKYKIGPYEISKRFADISYSINEEEDEIDSEELEDTTFKRGEKAESEDVDL